MLKIYRFLLFMVFFSPLISISQVAGIPFQQVSGTYTPITGGTVLGTPTNDDTSFPAQNIGFNFVYDGTTYTQVSIQSNGFIALGAAVSSSYTPISDGFGSNNVISALGRDLQGNTTTGELSYLTTGTAPNRIFTVQWKSYRKYNATGDDYNFQIKLYETGNYIEVVYGTMTSNATSTTVQTGLRGASNADFNNRTTTTNWSASTAGGTNAASLTLSNTVFPTSGQRYIWTSPLTPAVPSVLSQAPGIPTCIAGSDLSVSGTPALADEAWYWQTSATGTSTAQSTATPLTVFANGTYYARGFNSTLNLWSTAASIVVSNFPAPATPPAPVAAQNPACVPGTTISSVAAPIGETYYWQGTNSTGLSTTDNASAPYNVTASGTYYLRSQDAGGCWSTPSSISMTINSVIPPDPTASIPNFNYCSTANPINVSAQVPVLSGPQTFNQTATASGTDNTGVTATVNVSGITGTVTSAVLNASIGTQCYLTGFAWYYYSIIVNGTTVATQQCNQTNFDLTPYLPITSVSIVSADDPADGFGDFVNMSCNVVINFNGPLPSQPAYTIDWYDAASAGTYQVSGTTANVLGTPALPVAVTGVHTFYAGTNLGGCASTGRVPVSATISSVNVPLTPVNVTCNGFNNGSFTEGTPLCGTGPFEYSVNGGPFGPIPTNLTAGSYSVVIREIATPTNLSGTNTVVITEPSAPTALTATGVTFYNASLGWTAQGTETTWTIEYGPAGFTPGTGTIQTATTNPWPISGLTEDTDYEFYVSAGCSPTSAVAGPFAFSTDAPFYTYDNSCGPGFTDITSTGTPAGFSGFTPNYFDDEEVGLTLPWSWNINGQTVTDITIGANGGVLFNTLTGNVGYSPTGNGMFIYNQDLELNDANGVYYQSVGTAPNRQFIIQWNGVEDYSGTFTPPGNPGSFQIVVDEATGEVYYIYDDVDFGNPGMNNGAQAYISINTTNGGQVISSLSSTYLTNNSCIHFYNALCPNVQNFSSIIFSNDALLDWNPGAYNESAWTLIYGPAGFDPLTSGTTLNLTSSDANFGGSLTQLTTYDVYIYSECAADGLTSDGYFFQFTTKPYCADPTALAGTTDVDSLNLTWNWIANPTYDIQQFNIQYSMEGLNNFTEVIANGVNFADTVVDATLIPSGVYEVYIQAACLTGDTSNWVGPISLVMPLENDTTCSAPLLNVDETQYIFNNTGATVSLGENAIAPNATGAQTTDGWINSTLNSTLWYKFVAPSTGNIRINSTGRTYDGQIGVYELTNCDDFNTFSLIAANDDEIGGTSKAPNFTVCGLTPGTEYYILFDGFNGTQGEFAIMLKEINLNAGTANPTSNICTGDDIVLFATIAGFDNGGTWSSAIPSVNASITDSLFSSTGLAYQTFDFEYRVVDGCAYDTIISQVEIFAPSNAGLDGTITACRNQPINLFGGLNGTADLTGQWYDPSNNPVNENVTTLNFAGNYNYDYIVGNGVCPDDTSNVVVTVTSCNHLSIDEEIFEGVSIHPNPTAGILFIESGIQFDMTITDANGRFVSTNTSSVAIGTTSVDLTTVERGVYFVNLTNGTSSKVYRVIVQ